jgi:formyltetrahydrofolate deformylase
VRAVLLLQCPDRPGIVAAVGAFIADANGNVVEADQHSDPAAGLFLQRVEFDVDTALDALHVGFAPIAQRFSMDWSLRDLASRQRIAVLASRQGHCLADLLARHVLGELAGDFVVVVSNHDTHAGLVERFGVPFRHLAVLGDAPEAREAQEREIGAVLEAAAVDVVVLARYMRVLPPWLT